MNNDNFYLIYIQENINELEEYVKGGEDEFKKSHLIQDATTRKLHVITESIRRLSDNLKNSHPEINWKRISGFRNVIVHDYLGLDMDKIWEVIKIDIPELIRVIRTLINY